MSNLIEKVKSKQISRRNFLKATAASTAGLALAGCGGALTMVSSGQTDSLEEGKWVTHFCGGGCGGVCLNRSYVVDGIVVRQKTDDLHTDSPDYPQQRGCLKGRLRRLQVFGADRLKYPMKRKHWEPGTGGDRSLRGRDEWVRISWDEALDLVATEIKRIKET